MMLDIEGDISIHYAYFCCRDFKINYLLGLHIALDEGFAWLSTLGGAHSALGETFLQHVSLCGLISSVSDMKKMHSLVSDKLDLLLLLLSIEVFL